MRVVRLTTDNRDRMKHDREDDQLDETLEESFPASDAPSNTPETGVRPEPEGDDDSDLT